MVKKKIRVCVALGSNVGDRAANLSRALDEIARGLAAKVLKVSRVYETRPFAGMKQRNYYNAVAMFETDIGPLELLDIFKSIEKKLGRRRASGGWLPRALDLDILFYGSGRFSYPNLEIPHPRLKDRDFALIPLAELFGRGLLPVLARAASSLLKDIRPEDRTVIARVAGCLNPAGGKK
ncbi:MAG: 2-amino-4-hydroxy-6-hydroxymethyldihydropteridine diphosphokinase [Endomicrobiia bacterium]|nr:2-amino-4-hydroxy-6-hydroxymethyldihydropteridine diphosphokinase [Endomicrobiia bacterium]